MADNITIKDGSGASVVLGAKDVSSVYYPQSTPVTPAGVTMVGTAGSAAAGVLTIQGIASGTVVPVSDGSGSLTVDNGGTFVVQENGSWVQVDDAAFTPATSKIAMIGAEFDDSSPDSVDEGDGGAVRMSGNRNLYVRIRDNAGNERGMNVDASGRASVVQPSDDTTLLAQRSINGGAEYETVAASQTAQTLGATGATGDYIAGVLVVPATTSPGNVLLLDNATSITIFTGGASSVSNLVPFFIPLGLISVSGAWKITTGANVSCIGIGNFT